MKTLKNILQKVPTESVVGSIDRSISAIQYDSRSVEQDTIFVAIKGGVYDGHTFIKKAIKLGAVVIVCERLPYKLNRRAYLYKSKKYSESLGAHGFKLL